MSGLGRKRTLRTPQPAKRMYACKHGLIAVHKPAAEKHIQKQDNQQAKHKDAAPAQGGSVRKAKSSVAGSLASHIQRPEDEKS